MNSYRIRKRSVKKDISFLLSGEETSASCQNYIGKFLKKFRTFFNKVRSFFRNVGMGCFHIHTERCFTRPDRRRPCSTNVQDVKKGKRLTEPSSQNS